jgi:cell wall-associated NlpC family hydrolase
MRPTTLAVLCVLMLAAPAAAAERPTPRSWAQAQIARVTAAGLLGGDAARFRPDEPITGTELEELVAGLVPDAVATEPASGNVAIAGLDARLVRALGLQDAAYRFFRGARAAGLDPPKRFGTEAVARLLGLRFNHPAGTDDLELLPAEPATHAEAAFSAARVLDLDESDLRRVDELSRTFVLPAPTLWQTRLLRTAVTLIGYPYVWGGVQDGFDCSGFVWRVVKLKRYTGGAALAGVLRGRTTFQMSTERPADSRIGLTELQPADVLFFGPRGPRSKPAQVDHMGLYLGGGWMIHSSRYGVALDRVEQWRADGFAWARRPLAEAGLEPVF